MAKFLGESGLTKLWELIKNLVASTATSTLNSAKNEAASKASSALSNAKAYTDDMWNELFNGEDDMHFKSEYMPSYVDDVLEFANTVAAPTVTTGSAIEGSEVYYDTTNDVFVWKSGSSYFNNGSDGDNYGTSTTEGRMPYGGKIYVNKGNKKTYRWSGSELTVISETLALGNTSGTAFRGDLGKTAYDHAVAKGSKFASGLYKITTNDQGHVTAATAVAKSDITALGIPGQDTNTHWVSGTKVGASNTAQSNAAANGTVYLNHIENGAVKDSHAIKSGGATTVACDSTGAITISSTVHTEITADDVVAKCV